MQQQKPLAQYNADFFLLRTPALPLNQLQAFWDALAQQENHDDLFQQLLRNELFREAIYLASPDLFRQAERYLAGELQKEKAKTKLRISLYEYFCRMSSRSTPFGVFAGCTLGFTGDTTQIDPGDTSAFERFARIDSDCLGKLIIELSKSAAIRKQLTYYPNSSIYRQGGQLRYTEYRLTSQNHRSYHIASAQNNSVISSLLRFTAAGRSFSEITAHVTAMGYPEADAEAYIHELIDGQVLVSSLLPNITGQEYYMRLSQLLEQMEIPGFALPGHLANAIRSIQAIAAAPDKIAACQQVYHQLADASEWLNEKHILQVDMYRNAPQCTLGNDIIDQVREGIDVIARLNPYPMQYKRITKFSRAFFERYEYQVVPLAEALDTEIGIGYNKAESLADRYKPAADFEYNSYFDFKVRKYYEAQFKDETVITITEEELEKQGGNSYQLPDSFGTLIKLTGPATAPQIQVKSLGGPSGANLMGRFSFLSNQLTDQLRTLCANEEMLQPDKIFAEITHLPQDRLANVLIRQVLRGYEIPYLAHSTLPPEQQIHISDLYLYMSGSRLVLYSKKLKKEIVPRLSTAHNFSKSLPIYNFLCDYQFQNLQGSAYWDWGPLGQKPFLPRVQYKNIIISPARWQLWLDQLQKKEKTPGADMNQRFREIAAQKKIPRYVLLTMSDNELLLDTHNNFCVDYLVRALQRFKSVNLHEFLHDFSNDTVMHGKDVYANEFNIPFVRTTTEPVSNTQKAVKPALRFEDKLPRKYHPGSEWLYLKLYSSYETTNRILTQTVFPYLRKLSKEGSLQRWFFIRYVDPLDHLRIRLHIPDAARRGLILGELTAKLQPFLKNKVIWDVQLGTYVRELERYDQQTMELSEDCFHSNSVVISHILDLPQCSNERELFYAALLLTDSMIRAFRLPDEERLQFVKNQYDGFGREFGLAQSAGMRDYLSDYYRNNNRAVLELVTGNLTPAANLDAQFATSIRKLAGQSYAACTAIAQQLHSITGDAKYQSYVMRLLPSYIHMSVNRLFNIGQRQKELYVYSFLHSFYQSLKARKINING